MADNLRPRDRSRCMSGIRSRHTRPERIVRSIVHRMGYRFRLHRRDLPGAPDLVLPRYHAVIFVHGCFWHWHADPLCPIAGQPKSNVAYWRPKLGRTRGRDRGNADALESAGWGVLTVWECELKDLDRVMSRVYAFLADRRGQTEQTY